MVSVYSAGGHKDRLHGVCINCLLCIYMELFTIIRWWSKSGRMLANYYGWEGGEGRVKSGVANSIVITPLHFNDNGEDGVSGSIDVTYSSLHILHAHSYI